MKSGAITVFFPKSSLFALALAKHCGSCYYINRKAASGFAKYKMNIFLSVLELTPPDPGIFFSIPTDFESLQTLFSDS